MRFNKSWRVIRLAEYAETVFPHLPLALRNSLYFYPPYLEPLHSHFRCLIISTEPLVCFVFYVKQKFGLPIPFKPIGVQQAGLTAHISLDIENQILTYFRRNYIKAHLFGNVHFPAQSPLWKARTNQELNLSFPLTDLVKQFSHGRRNEYNRPLGPFTILKNQNTEAVFAFQKQFILDLEHRAYSSTLKNEVLKRFADVCAFEQLHTYCAVNAEGEIQACMLMCEYANSLYLMYSARLHTPEAKALGAKLILYVIAEYANSNYRIDCEGSDIPGIQSYYASFGASKTTYQEVSVAFWN